MWLVVVVVVVVVVSFKPLRAGGWRSPRRQWRPPLALLPPRIPVKERENKKSDYKEIILIAKCGIYALLI